MLSFICGKMAFNMCWRHRKKFKLWSLPAEMESHMSTFFWQVFCDNGSGVPSYNKRTRKPYNTAVMSEFIQNSHYNYKNTSFLAFSFLRKREYTVLLKKASFCKAWTAFALLKFCVPYYVFHLHTAASFAFQCSRTEFWQVHHSWVHHR